MDTSNINLLFFGITHDIAGSRKIDWEITPGTTVGELKKQLQEKFPKLSELKTYAIAVDEEYAPDEKPLTGQEEVAIIPPVSGG